MIAEPRRIVDHAKVVLNQVEDEQGALALFGREHTLVDDFEDDIRVLDDGLELVEVRHRRNPSRGSGVSNQKGSASRHG